MPFKRANFIIVALTDLDGYGFDEYTLPVIVSLAVAYEPDDRVIVHTGVQAFFLASKAAQKRVDRLVTDAQRLKKEKGFESLGIGTAEGPLYAEFTWWGKFKGGNISPIGDASGEALKNAQKMNQGKGPY